MMNYQFIPFINNVVFMSPSGFSLSGSMWVQGLNLFRTKARSKRLATILYTLGSTRLLDERCDMSNRRAGVKVCQADGMQFCHCDVRHRLQTGQMDNSDAVIKLSIERFASTAIESFVSLEGVCSCLASCAYPSVDQARIGSRW